MGKQHVQSADLKTRIWQQVRTRYQQHYGTEHMAKGSCLYWTLTGIPILHAHGYRALLQAGSMSWPIITPQMDDGIRATHFTYEWSPWRPESRAAMAKGALPKIHIWIGLPDENELVDFSTHWFPQQARKEGLEWHTKPPPDFLWCSPSTLPDGVHYKPDLSAIGYILNKVRNNNSP